MFDPHLFHLMKFNINLCLIKPSGKTVISAKQLTKMNQNKGKFEEKQ